MYSASRPRPSKWSRSRCHRSCAHEVLCGSWPPAINYNRLSGRRSARRSRDQEPAEGCLLSDPTPSTSRERRLGIVWKVGSVVRSVKVGDEVVIHCGVWTRTPGGQSGAVHVRRGFRIWGLRDQPGAASRSSRRAAHHASEANTSPGTPRRLHAGRRTAYRMLAAWPPHTVRPATWCSSGAAPAASAARRSDRARRAAIAVAVVSSETRSRFCTRLGAKGCIKPQKFSHWGMPRTGRTRSATANG